MYRNLPKISPLSKTCPPPFFEWSCCKGCSSLSKVCPPNCAAVHAVTSSKKHWRSSTVQEEGLTNEGRHHLLLLHKQVHDKRGIAELLHAQITRARLTVCEVGIFREKYNNSQKYAHAPLSFRSHLSSLPMGESKYICYMPIYIIYVASPAESAVHDQIDHGSIKSTSVLSQCSFPCVVPLAPWNCIMKWLLVWQNSHSQSDYS